MDLNTEIEIKLQTIEERLIIQKEIIIQEIIDIIIDDIDNNKFILVESISTNSKYNFKAPYYKCKTKYKNYKIVLDNFGVIHLYKGYLWWYKKTQIHVISFINNQKLLDILNTKYNFIQLMER